MIWQFWHLGCSLMEQSTCDICDTDYISDNWEPGFMTIFVTWQLIVTLDSIRNSCNVYFRYNSNDENHACYLLNSDVNTFEDAEAFCVSLGGHLASSLDEGLDIFTNYHLYQFNHFHHLQYLQRRTTSSAGYWWALGVGCRCIGLGLSVVNTTVKILGGGGMVENFKCKYWTI